MTIRVVLIIPLLCCLHLPSFTQDNLSLNGNWEIIFDDKNEGRTAGWMTANGFDAHLEKEEIEVPGAWECYNEDYEGVAFYRRIFNLPAEWKNKVIRLQFGAVNYRAEVWLNDEVVGFHEGGFTPFEFRVDEMSKPGETNVLTMRVVGPIVLSDKEIDGVKSMETPQWRGGLTAGIWQDVNLIATGLTYIDDVYIEPSIEDNTATFHLDLDHTAISGSRLALEINITDASENGKTVAQIRENLSVRPGRNKSKWTLQIPEAIYWSPDNPHLYRGTVTISTENERSDHWSHRFGLRELTIKDKDFYLNGAPIYIKACFFEGLYPNGIAHPDSEEMARKEIRLAKEAGFNMIRPWRRPPVPMWLDLADEMGVLVVGSPALECMTLPRSTPYLPKRVENEVRNAILRDRNRTCVVQWELFNELHRPVLKQLMRPMAMLARELDPTRLILDESGGWAFGANIYLPNEFEPTKFNDIHNYPGPFINDRLFEGFLTIGLTDEEKKARGFNGRTPGRNVVPGLMSFVSELGYGSLPDLVLNNQLFRENGNPLTPAYRYHERIHRQQKEVLEESGFQYQYPDLEQFYRDQQSIHGSANKRMIEAVRTNPDVDGYCIHALAAGDWILGAGLLDLWRNPKTYAYEGTKAANQPRILVIRTRPRNVYAEKGTRLQITGINELEPISAELQVRITSPSGKVVFRQTVSASLSGRVTALLDRELTTNKWRGTYIVHAKLIGEDEVILAENMEEFEVFQKRNLKVPKQQIAVLDDNGGLTTFLQNKGVEVVEFDNTLPVSVPVFVTGTRSKITGRASEYSALIDFVKNGGTAVYIDGSIQATQDDPEIFPFRAKVHPVKGLWTCIPHLVRDHPVFEGLPVNGMMRNTYENVWALNTFRDLDTGTDMPVETVVGAIGFDWFSREHEMHYSGPGASWWGADVAVVPVGEGRCIASQLRLVENLGKDPVADRILFNLMRFVR